MSAIRFLRTSVGRVGREHLAPGPDGPPGAVRFCAHKQAQLQIPDLGPFLLKLSAQGGLTLCALLFHLAQEPKKTIFTRRNVLQRTLVHALEKL